MHVRLGHMEIGTNQGYQERVKHPVNKLQKNLLALIMIRLGHFDAIFLTRCPEPG